jgi:hypothetical protein
MTRWHAQDGFCLFLAVHVKGCLEGVSDLRIDFNGYDRESKDRRKEELTKMSEEVWSCQGDF